ncbi:TolC family protein [Arcobacter roscoffensis]|uniref:TolC family protein n=1 Tax=Arcobacter roscoffensis TaxID=2961520 RepID=A0ABY5E351_9BACT|nr:TolC family protein [Arcobacter roscoffensis]UTJ06307.1 TolC family protein [Arcobacter roscoffensis]
MKSFRIIKYSIVSLLASATLLNAYTLKQSVQKVLDQNPEVIAEKKNQEAFKKYVDEREGNYYPRIDIDGRIEKVNTEKNYDQPNNNNNEDGSDQEDGYNFGIALNQMIYDGDLTPSRVNEAKHNDLANKYRTNRNIENIVLETIGAYTGFVQYTEFLALTKDMIATNEENLEIAKQKEDISGEVLETYQVDSKLSFVKEKYLEEQDLKSSRVSTFKRYIGGKPQGNECRPSIDETIFPSSLQKIVEKAVLNNYEILEQIERVKAQREKIAQADASFLPSLNLELKAITDNDLSLNEEGVENQAFARLNLAWNLYNGGSDHAISTQEELFLAEQKQRLDAITKKVVENVKVTYQRYQKNKKRIDVLKKYVVANENIVDVYKSEFEAGTRTFVDILNAQTDLYEAKKSLVSREFELYSNYYDLLNSLSILVPSVLNSNISQCVNSKLEDTSTTNKVENNSLAVSEELTALLGDEESKAKVEETEPKDDVIAQDTNELTEDLLGEDEASQEVIVQSGSIDELLTADEKTYTLNIATTRGLDAANNYAQINGLDSSSTYTYEFGPSMKSAKVIYGIFDSVKEAKAALSSLPEGVKKAKPYIDNVSKHQKLYKKYH